MSEHYKIPLIREMPSNDRPRERLAQRGPASLKPGELLAILFRTGTREISAVELAERVLTHFGSLTALSRASIDELRGVGGVGFAKAVEIQAAFELGRRLGEEKGHDKEPIKTPRDVHRFMADDMRPLDRETFVILMLNTKNYITKKHTVSVGSLNASVVHPRECFKEAIAAHAAAIILVHNHPSGDAEPSNEDISLTRRLIQAGDLLGIRVLDHVIIAGDKYVSLTDRGVR
ncbi:MAG: DNA repair protein RadC [Candidatus Lindowbacteria bacterium]|nr:DNA repair protein RadC [Candidatus Lindowbacteria bacterium]